VAVCFLQLTLLLAIDVACKNHKYIELLKCFLQKILYLLYFLLMHLSFVFRNLAQEALHRLPVKAHCDQHFTRKPTLGVTTYVFAQKNLKFGMYLACVFLFLACVFLLKHLYRNLHM
jgi:hypothetical protein